MPVIACFFVNAWYVSLVCDSHGLDWADSAPSEFEKRDDSYKEKNATIRIYDYETKRTHFTTFEKVKPRSCEVL